MKALLYSIPARFPKPTFNFLFTNQLIELVNKGLYFHLVKLMSNQILAIKHIFFSVSEKADFNQCLDFCLYPFKSCQMKHAAQIIKYKPFHRYPFNKLISSPNH